MSANPDLDPLHFSVPDHVRWSRVNIAEALPGVCTALGFTFWLRPNEIGVRTGLHAVGACDQSDIKMPERTEDHILGAFYGRVAINLTAQQRFFDSVAGYSSDMVDTVMLGGAGDSPQPAQPANTARLATLLRAVKMAWVVLRLPGRQVRLREEVITWWLHVVGSGKPADVEEAVTVLSQGHDWFEHVMGIHMATGMIMGAVYAQLATLAANAGHAGLEIELVGADDGIDETRSLHHLWDVAHGRESLEDFIAQHGFHGPVEGQISEPSWREDPALLAGVIEEMSHRDEGESPQALERRRAESRAVARQTLMSSLSLLQRMQARFLLALTSRSVAMRENSKACFLRAIDGARCAARELGEQLAESGTLSAAADIYHLTYPEIVTATFRDNPVKLQELIAQRATQRAEYLKVDLPFEWSGVPEPIRLASNDSAEPSGLQGVGVSPGIVEGRVQVVTNPAGEICMQAGDILVCPMTDPSWAGLLMLAAGAVIDMGGPLSHGAVVARELGIPCVMNTAQGTRTLRTGDVIRMDGAEGTIEILEAAERLEAGHG